jgi:hypothetical protein
VGRRAVLGLVLALTVAEPTNEDLRVNRIDAAGFVREMRRVQYDYEPADTPAVLAQWAETVVTGTIVGVKPGPSYADGPDAEPATATSLIEVRVERLLAGGRSLVLDGSVYVEVGHPAFVGTGVEDGTMVPFDHEAFAATDPKASGLFFLADRTNASYSEYVFNAKAGRPPGARFAGAFTQGFLIEDSNGRLVSVRVGLSAMPPAWHHLSSVEDVVAKLRSTPHP